MKKRFTEEQIIKVIKEYESGINPDNICRGPGISRGTFYNWRRKYGGSRTNHSWYTKRMFF